MAKLDMTDEEFMRQYEEATRRGEMADRVEPRPQATRYNNETGRIEVELTNGCLFAFPPALASELDGATEEELSEVEPHGEAVAWDTLDVHISLPGLILHLLNARAWAAKWLGSLTSEAKARAARENGKKGGRPRKRKAG